MSRIGVHMVDRVGLCEVWRKVAIEAWYDAQDHVGAADADPEPYVEAAADAAVRAVVHWLRHIDRLDEIPGAGNGMPRFNPLWDAATAIENELGDPESLIAAAEERRMRLLAIDPGPEA